MHRILLLYHDDVIKWKHFPRYWPFVRGIHRGSVNSPHKGQWRGALMVSLICVWINGWVNNRGSDDLRRHRGHYDVIVMQSLHCGFMWCNYGMIIIFPVQWHLKNDMVRIDRYVTASKHNKTRTVCVVLGVCSLFSLYITAYMYRNVEELRALFYLPHYNEIIISS